MDIFENLENLIISEDCFNDIMDIVEEIINEYIDRKEKMKRAAERSISGRIAKVGEKTREYEKNDKDNSSFEELFDAQARLEHARDVAYGPNRVHDYSKYSDD